MKKLQTLVYLILLAGIIIASVQGFNSYKEKSLICASYFNATVSANNYNEQLYWQENGICCRYALINNSIKEKCENGI